MRAKAGNYDQCAAETLRALRATRSQRAFARRLGYRANPITDWEHGRRFPTATEFLRAARLVHVDVAGAFRAFHPTPPPLDSSGRITVATWLTALRGTSSIRDLAIRAGCSRFALGRWLNGTAEPRLPDFFRCVDATTGRLPDLVAALVPIQAVPSLVARHRSMQAARTLAFDAPWTEAILRILETTAYQRLDVHTEGFIASRLGISLAMERDCLVRLKRAGVIRMERGLLREQRPLSVDTRGDEESMTVLLHHWTKVAHDRTQQRRARDLFAYNVMSTSLADFERIRELLRRTFREVQSIVAASEPSERVALLNLQLLELA